MTLAETSLKIAEIGLPIAFLIAFGTLLIFLIIAFYAYTSLAWYAIAKKLRYKKAWLAWIPLANCAMML